MTTHYDQRSVLLFRNVHLPTGVIINKAYLKLKYWLSDGANRVDVWISAAPIQVMAPPISSLPWTIEEMEDLATVKTQARAHWEEDLGPVPDGEIIQTCDFSCVLQEIVDQGGATDVAIFVESYAVECSGIQIQEEVTDPNLITCYGITEPSNQGYSTELHYWWVHFYEEFGEGGVSGGGAADVSVVKESITASGGAQSSGESLARNFYAPEGGVLGVAAEATIFMGFSPQGGVVVQPAREIWGVTNEPPFGTTITGVSAGGSAAVYKQSFYSFSAVGKVIVEGATAGGAITGVRYVASGGVRVTNVLDPTIAYFRFHKTVDVLWHLRTYVRKDIDFIWNTGRLIMYWYRVVGEALPFDPCDPKPCCQKVVMNVHARTLAELCEKLSKRKFNWRVQSVEKYSQPAVLGNAFDDWEDQQAAYEEYSATNDHCDDLQPFEICNIPACADFCVDYDMRVSFKFDIHKVSLNGIHEYEAGNEESAARRVSIGGSAKVTLVRFIPEFRFVSTGEWEETQLGLGSATEYRPSHLFGRGGTLGGGTAGVAANKWSYVGGSWPSVNGPIVAQFARSADLESVGGLAPWTYPEYALSVDPTDLMTHQGGPDADVDLSHGKTSEYLVLSGFELDLPSDINILGVRLVLHRWAEHVGVREVAIVLVHGDEIISTNIAEPTFRWPLLPTTVPYGTTGTDEQTPVFEPLSGVWDVDVLNSPEFGVAIQIADFDNLAGSIAHLDYLSLEVYYDQINAQCIRIGGTADVSATRFAAYATGSVGIGGHSPVRVTRRYVPSNRGTGQPTHLVFSGTYSTNFRYVTPEQNQMWLDQDEVEPANLGTVAYWASAAQTVPLQSILPSEEVVDSPWSYPQYALVADASRYAYANLQNVTVSEFLVVRNWNIDFPEHTKIHGIRVILGNRYCTGNIVRDRHVYLVQGNVPVSNDLAKTADDWDLNPVTVSYGSNGIDGGTQFRDVTLNPWKLEEIADPTFGVAIAVWAPPLGPGEEEPVSKLAKIDGIAMEFTIEVYGRTQTYVSHLKLSNSATCYPDPYTGSGGVSGGGWAVVKPYWDTMQGGVLGGGNYASRRYFEYVASGGITVEGQGSIIQADRSFTGSGSLVISGQAQCKSSNHIWVSDGIGIHVLGGASVRAPSLGTVMIDIHAGMQIVSLQGVYSEDVDEDTLEVLDDVVSSCGCLAIPLTIEVKHNLHWNNVLAKFLTRNAIAMPSVMTLYYNETNASWQANVHYKGLSADANTIERWDFVFEVQCTNNMGGVHIGRSVWKLGVSAFRKNLSTLEDYDTRIVVGVMSEAICDTNINELEFGVIFDTQSGLATVTPTHVDIYQATLYDNIGLFKNRNWYDYPDLTLSVSQSGSPTVPQRIDLHSVINPESSVSPFILPSS